MTATTIRAWIDLDKVVPPQVQTQLAESLREVQELEWTMGEVLRRAWEASKAFDDASDDAVPAGPSLDARDGAHALLRQVSGMEALHHAVLRLDAYMQAFEGRPEWKVDGEG